jgi:DNA repair exonuclease SbcCD ATPase subunit
MKHKRDLKSTEKEQLLQQRPNRPNTDPTWIHSMKRNIKRQGSLSVIQERYDHLLLCSQQIPLLCKDITTLQNKINEYESYLDDCFTIPFNPSCDSCAKQSWKITYDRYDQELPSLQNSLQTLHTQIQSYQSPLIQTPLVYSDHEPYLASLLLLMTSTERYLESLKRYETEKVLHTAYDKWFTAYTLIATQLDDMNRAYDRCEAERREAERIRTEKELEHSWYNSLHRFRSAVAVYNTHLHTEHAALIEKHDYLQSLLRKETLCQQLHNIQSILTVYPAWIKWKEQCNMVADISLRIREFEVMLRYGSNTSLTPSPLLLSERAKQYLQITTTLSGLFGSYRKWIYTTHIAPLIHSRVNHVLSTICDQIHFESEWLDTIDYLSWFIRDGTSRVVLEKSSGFQRFIVGIAMRVALRDIGLSRIQYSDLFIDEGFTACDVDHLEKVPSFLQGLLHFYKSIYLVTHLEDLKACSPHHIYISRDANGLAHIQSIDNTTSTHVVSIPIKKRGRPPKKSKTNHTPAASPSNDPSS